MFKWIKGLFSRSSAKKIELDHSDLQIPLVVTIGKKFPKKRMAIRHLHIHEVYETKNVYRAIGNAAYKADGRFDDILSDVMEKYGGFSESYNTIPQRDAVVIAHKISSEAIDFHLHFEDKDFEYGNFRFG